MITTTIKEELLSTQNLLGARRLVAEKDLDLAQQKVDKCKKDLESIDKQAVDIQKDLDKIAAFEKWDKENNTEVKTTRTKKDASTTTEPTLETASTEDISKKAE